MPQTPSPATGTVPGYTWLVAAKGFRTYNRLIDTPEASKLLAQAFETLCLSVPWNRTSDTIQCPGTGFLYD